MTDADPAPAAAFRNAAAYEMLMGRWSRRLTPLLIGFGGLADGDRVLDVGCGTGSLTFALPQAANVAAVTAIDLSPGYVEHVRTHSSDPRITVQQGDVRDLPFEDNAFDRAFSMLVLHFVPDSARAVGEMRRVVRPGGTVTAAVWDEFSGLPHFHILFDIAGTLDPSLKGAHFRPLSAPGEMAAAWRAAGLVAVEQRDLVIRMEFASFDDYWMPMTAGEGPPGQLMSGLSDAAKAALCEHVRRAYLYGRPDGPRSFASVAFACRGTVPQ